MKKIRISYKKIGDGEPTFIIAEMAWSHDGSEEKAKTIIKGAAKAKADAICFHITNMEEYMVPNYQTGKGRVSEGKENKPIFEYLSEINLPPKVWKKLFSYAKKLRLILLSMPNDFSSLRLSVKLKCNGFVISPASIDDEDFIKAIALKKKPIFLRIGGCTLAEIEKAIFLIKKFKNENITLITGFQNYPTKPERANLKYIQTLKQLFGLPVGFADHTNASSPLAFFLPIAAIGAGANIIEKHITHNRALKGEDFESALNPDEFKSFVSNLREVEKGLGDFAVQPLSKEEMEYRKVVKKRMIAKVDIKKGEKITPEKICFKRADEGLYYEEKKFVLNRIAKVDIKKDEPITFKKIL